MYNNGVLPVVDAGRVTMCDDTYELDDTFLIRHAPGHSPGHERIELTSQVSHDVFSGDMQHSPI
ncbi:hypothetical protein [Burkholderia cenocepacia]|uniref:hypothetical protein n=1 Tax=Burkholderia cenocepacia TaxID=95486 RepID=UPI0007574AA5|nr:hypothetical protein [Burkholderia cenocepacia]AOK38704.1 hypothetical protein WL90_31065 [Burkholderia cenocepacia]KWF67501.1 hypothetical protein WL89_08060 [Burkholderia cenocepacia]